MSKHLRLLALCLGFFIVIIDVMIVNVALPNIAKDLNVGISGLQWVMAGYTLTFACLLLSAGNLGDRVGAKSTFLWGLVLFVLTSLGCGLASAAWVLIVFRLFQGVAAAMLVPTSVALINSSYETEEERAKAIGIWASIGGIAGAAGPVLGAILTAWFGWRAVFFVNIPIGVIAILLTLKYVPSPASAMEGNFDLPGQAMGIISIAALAFSLIEAGNYGWFSAIVIIAFGIFILSFITFLFIESRTLTPMFPLAFFRSPTFSAAIVVGMVLNLAAYGELFVLSLYFQQVREYSVFMTGFALLPFVGMGVVGSYLGGRLTSAIGSKWPIAIGLSIGVVGFIALLITREQAPTYILLFLPLCMIGFGASFTMPAATLAAITSAPDNRAGIASGAFNASRQVGSLMGVAIFGTILTASRHFIIGMHSTLIISALIYLGGCIIALLYMKRKEPTY